MDNNDELEEQQDQQDEVPPPSAFPIVIVVDDDSDDEDIEAIFEPPPTQNVPVKRALSDDDDDEDEIDDDQPVPKRAAEEAQGTVQENLEQIRLSIETMLGLTLNGLAEVLVRNEPGLYTTVTDLRRSLAAHQGNLGTTWDNFRIALGTPAPPPPAINSQSAPPSQSQIQPGAPTAPVELTDVAVKTLLRNLGRTLELYAALIKRLGYGNGGGAPPADVFDYNRVAYTICREMNLLADLLQYTYRQKLHNLSKNLATRSAQAKQRVEAAITRALDASENVTVAEEQQVHFLQECPPLMFQGMDEPQIRYRISIPRDDFLTNPIHLVQETNETLPKSENVPQNTLVQGEENLLIRFGTLGIINGTRSIAVNFDAHGIIFHIYQIYMTSGWENPTSTQPPQGKAVRALDFHLNKLKEGSLQYQIKAKPRSEKIPSTGEEQSQQIEISVSGVVEGPNTIGSVNGQRIEFVFVLPPHLCMKHVNTVGVRDLVLKIQFAK
ncbi:uncharacterized protein LOC118436582 [Folsomia candida]|nr:uncharacterized protein LOC118436582 [Folsomia candida]